MDSTTAANKRNHHLPSAQFHTQTLNPNFSPKYPPPKISQKREKKSEKRSSNYLPNQCRDPDGRPPLWCSVRAAPSRESRAAVRAGLLEGSRGFWKPPIEQDWPNGERLEGSIPLVFNRVRRFFLLISFFSSLFTLSFLKKKKNCFFYSLCLYSQLLSFPSSPVFKAL